MLQLDCVILDVLLQWVADPTFILPLMCIYRREPLLDVPMSAAVCVVSVLELFKVSNAKINSFMSRTCESNR